MLFYEFVTFAPLPDCPTSPSAPTPPTIARPITDRSSPRMSPPPPPPPPAYPPFRGDPHPRPATIGQLKETPYHPSSVKDELRRNLIRKLKHEEELFPGILGYRETVIPQVVNAILSKHDMLFLGLRGQAKTRILRLLPT